MESRRISADSVRTLFEPSSVAVVGASMNGFGRLAVENLSTFAGEVACVNPKYDELLGFRCFSSLTEVPFRPDTVLVAVARQRVVPVLEEAAGLGVKSAVVFAIGFAEADEEGHDLQERLVAIASEADMAVLGPNCQGIVNFVQPSALYMDAVMPYRAGRVGLLAQSGSVVTALTNNKRGVRWSHAVSSGNEAVVDAAAVLEYFVASPEVDTICMFVETIRRPEAFFRQCDLAFELGKPVVVMKTGRTAAAQEAATAHSGALAVPDRLVDALFRRHRVSRAESLDELLETTIAMQSKRRPAGGRIGAMTASGGQIELILDNLSGTGLSASPFAEETQAELRETLPSFLAPKNPLDWWGVADPDAAVTNLVRTVAADENVDVVVQAADFTVGPTGADNRAVTAVQTSRELTAERDELFVVLDGVGGAADPTDVEGGLEAGYLVLSGIPTGLRALGHLVSYCRPAASPAAAVVNIDRETVLSALDPVGQNLKGGGTAFKVLGEAGLLMAQGAVAGSKEDALALAGEYGYPVVAKIADDAIAHKSDHGGVILSIGSPPELEEAIERLQKIGATRFLVQEQVVGTEVFLGLQSEPGLGTFVIAGIGGIWTELLDDVQIRPVGLREGEAHDMIRRLRGYGQLAGARGTEPVDLDLLADCIQRLDALGLVVGDRIRSLDVNPLMLAGNRAVVVDALLVRRD